MKAAPYSGLTPDRVLDALDSIGLRPDGRLLSLNSYENRVYQAWMDEGQPMVAKFYRPARWSDAQIREEHGFALELTAAEIPVVAPVATAKKTLHSFEGFRFAVYPRRGGRPPELEDPQALEWIGRFLGRIHAVGARQRFRARTTLGLESHGIEPRTWLLGSGLVPADLAEAWTSVTAAALDGVRRSMERAGEVGAVRLHGDCHAGNVLWTADGPHFVDLDDSCMGPAIQDLWMLLSGERTVMERQLAAVVTGYENFREFDPRQLHLIEALRTLRLIHYSAWIARRWDDPAFPAAFPWFGTQRYWQDRILELREQIAAMDEPPLELEMRDR
jgi:Ser/Thr protein kinase RdoA (MazF antagonist)